jgi:hypothetical protein
MCNHSILDKQVYVQDKPSDQKLLLMHAAEGNGPVDALVCHLCHIQAPDGHCSVTYV